MFTFTLTVGIATILLVIVLNGFARRGALSRTQFAAALAGLGVAWLAGGLYVPALAHGSATIEVFWFGALLILYAAAHWVYYRFLGGSRGS